jgi:hypothetical protein
MPQGGEPPIFGELTSCGDGIAKGWVQPNRRGPCMVIIRLDGVPAGAAASMAKDGDGAPETTRRDFQVELDAARIARGGRLTAEYVTGTLRGPLAGRVTVAAEGADVGFPVLAAIKTGPFKKRCGLRVTGWIAVQNRGTAPALSGMIGGRCVVKSGPSAFSTEAWKAGGQLASGYEVTFPAMENAGPVIEAALRDDEGGREIWRGVFDESDLLHEDISQIVACGACRLGNASPEYLNARSAEFIKEMETAGEAGVHFETASLALRLVSWIRDRRDVETAFAAAVRMCPPAQIRLLPGPFLETFAPLICGLPRDMLDSAMRRLDATFVSSPENRIVSLLNVLARTRLTGLDDGGERIIGILNAMNHSQSALNWIWEAVSGSDSTNESNADLRQLIEFEIIARNVPFLSGYELRAARPA